MLIFKKEKLFIDFNFSLLLLLFIHVPPQVAVDPNERRVPFAKITVSIARKKEKERKNTRIKRSCFFFLFISVAHHYCSHILGSLDSSGG